MLYLGHVYLTFIDSFFPSFTLGKYFNNYWVIWSLKENILRSCFIHFGKHRDVLQDSFIRNENIHASYHLIKYGNLTLWSFNLTLKKIVNSILLSRLRSRHIILKNKFFKFLDRQLATHCSSYISHTHTHVYILRCVSVA